MGTVPTYLLPTYLSTYLTDFGFLQYTLLLIIFIYIWDHMYIRLVNRNLFYRGCGEIGMSDCMCVRLRASCV